jgi:transposase InsO family protein
MTTWVMVNLSARHSDHLHTAISSKYRVGLEVQGFRPGLTKRRLFQDQGPVGRCHGDGGTQQKFHSKGRRLKIVFGLDTSGPEMT